MHIPCLLNTFLSLGTTCMILDLVVLLAILLPSGRGVGVLT